MKRSLIAFLLTNCLLFAGPADLLARSAAQKHRQKQKPKPKPKHPLSPPCRTGCKPESNAPQLIADSPEDSALQNQLSDLARNLRSTVPGSYEKLSVFAARNSTSRWGSRAALALGYEDYSRNHGAQALGWFLKAQNDVLLREYAIFWTAQSQRELGRTADAFKTLQSFQHDYSNSALREQFLEAFAPTAVQNGHAQEAIDALNVYSATPSKSSLLIERARAYQSAHQLARAAKDFQTIFYKFPLADESKPAGLALTQLTHALGKEYPYPGVELQEQRAQAFFDAHKWREAQPEFQKLLTMLKDPANPARQRALLRVRCSLP
jgi:tetratricopeptide (TPR) repeat protein